MTKEDLMDLAKQYARFYMTVDETIAKQKLSDAIDAALAKARMDALEEAAKVCDAIDVEYDNAEVLATWCAEAVRALKDVNSNHTPDIKQVMADHIKAKAIHYFPFAISIDQAEKIIQEATGQTIQEQYPHCADLDTYSGVTYSDPPKGRLFMETKVVKWLIENRSADYFKRNDDIEGHPV